MHIWRALVLQHQWALDNPGRNNRAEKDNAGGGGGLSLHQNPPVMFHVHISRQVFSASTADNPEAPKKSAI